MNSKQNVCAIENKQDTDCVGVFFNIKLTLVVCGLLLVTTWRELSCSTKLKWNWVLKLWKVSTAATVCTAHDVVFHRLDFCTLFSSGALLSLFPLLADFSTNLTNAKHHQCQTNCWFLQGLHPSMLRFCMLQIWYCKFTTAKLLHLFIYKEPH